jgi:hypothetical protein
MKVFNPERFGNGSDGRKDRIKKERVEGKAKLCIRFLREGALRLARQENSQADKGYDNDITDHRQGFVVKNAKMGKII